MNTVPNQEPTLRDLLKVFDRRKRTAVGTIVICVLLSVLASVFMTRRYEASGIVQLQKSSSDSLDLDSMMGSALGGGGDSMSENVDLQTQANILQSDTLALKVINELNLEQNKDFKSSVNPLGLVTGLISPHGPPETAGRTLENSPRRRARALKVFHNHLKVKVTAGTRLIEVNFTNPDPSVSAAVVNHLVQSLIDFTFQTKFAATSQVSNWLTGQLGDLRKQSEDLAAQVVTMQKETGLFGVGGSDLQGKPIIYSPILDRLQASTAQLSQAQMNRLIKASVYQVVKTGNAELISELSGATLAGSSSPGVSGSLALIQSLRAQHATLEAQIGQDAAVYGSAYPKLIEERASLKRLEQSLQDEIARIAERAKNDNEIAEKTLSGSERAYHADRSAAEKLNDKAIEYSIVQREANESQQLYQDLLKRLKEAGILEGLHSSNITIVDSASPPSDPSTPNVPLFLTVGLAAGLFFGISATMLVDAVDNKVQGVEEVEALGISLIGLIPQVKTEEMEKGAILLDSRFSAFQEAVRRLRSTLLISRSGRPPQVVLITSGNPAEGKSLLSLNLAVSLAQFDKKVLLLEADMRRPVLMRRLGINEPKGLSVLLADGAATMETLLIHPDFPTLRFIPAGPVPPYPSELIGSPRMQSLISHWQTQYDFILIDCPPVLPVTDVQLIANMADATILVARAGYTTRVGLERAYKLLLPHMKDAAMPSMGVVLNFVPFKSAAYYGYYGYYGNKKYEYHQDEDGNDKA